MYTFDGGKKNCHSSFYLKDKGLHFKSDNNVYRLAIKYYHIMIFFYE